MVQQTRLYDPDKNETRPMRSKEDSMDYRYFPDPDLLPCVLSPEEISGLKANLPELPQQMFERLQKEDGLSEYDAGILTSSRGVAQYYDSLAHQVKDKKAAANWVMGEVSAALNQTEGLTIENAPVSPDTLAAIMGRVADGTINLKGAKKVFTAIWEGEQPDVDALIGKLGLKQISDGGRSPREECRHGGAVPLRQGKGVQRSRGAGHEGRPRKGLSGSRERAPA